jgi:hypothetical protein
MNEELCDACGNKTDHCNHFGKTVLCDPCREDMDEHGVYPLPGWITDDCLPDLLPILASQYAKNFPLTERFEDGSHVDDIA